VGVGVGLSVGVNVVLHCTTAAAAKTCPLSLSSAARWVGW